MLDIRKFDISKADVRYKKAQHFKNWHSKADCTNI